MHKYNNLYYSIYAEIYIYKAGRKTRSSLARSARGWLDSARLGSL